MTQETAPRTLQVLRSITVVCIVATAAAVLVVALLGVRVGTLGTFGSLVVLALVPADLGVMTAFAERRLRDDDTPSSTLELLDTRTLLVIGGAVAVLGLAITLAVRSGAAEPPALPVVEGTAAQCDGFEDGPFCTGPSVQGEVCDDEDAPFCRGPSAQGEADTP